MAHSFTVHPQRKSAQEPKQDRNLEAGADAEAMEGCCLLAFFPMDCSACFPIEPRTTIHNGLDPLTPIPLIKAMI